jgi:endonuclease YncB( thermonuclease family)
MLALAMSLTRLRTALRRYVMGQRRLTRRPASWLRARFTRHTRRALRLVGGGLLAAVAMLTLCVDHSPVGHKQSDEAPEAGDLRLTVIRVIDGDTFEVLYDEEPTSVRVFGIDAPEVGESGGWESTQALRRLLGNRRVTMVFPGPKKRDSFGRLLAIVYVDGTNVGHWLVQNGFARQYQP